MSAKTSIRVTRGSNLALRLVWSQSGQPIDLAGYTATIEDAAAEIATALAVAITIAEDGEITVTLQSAALLPLGSYPFRVRVVRPSPTSRLATPLIFLVIE